MKKLKVPYLETLDVLDLSSVGFLMEKAQRESIDVINWEEYSYKPIVAFDIARSKVNLYIRYFVKSNATRQHPNRMFRQDKTKAGKQTNI